MQLRTLLEEMTDLQKEVGQRMHDARLALEKADRQLVEWNAKSMDMDLRIDEIKVLGYRLVGSHLSHLIRAEERINDGRPRRLRNEGEIFYEHGRMWI